MWRVLLQAEPLPRTALAVTGDKTYSCPQYVGLHFGEHDRKQHDDDLVEFVDGKKVHGDVLYC